MEKNKSYQSTLTTKLTGDNGNNIDKRESESDNANVVKSVNNCGKYANKFHSGKYRHLIAFWMFGLCNHFCYGVMLSAAHDMLHDEPGGTTDSDAGNGTTVSNNHSQTTKPLQSEYLICNELSTGAVLLADILPCLIVKLIFPFLAHLVSYDVKVTATAIFGASSFIIVAFADNRVWMSLVGVVFASIATGVGENTFLGLTTFYPKNVVSSWSSGTGGAGFLSALAYAGFIGLGFSPRVTMLMLVAMPVSLILCYIFILPPASHCDVTLEEDNLEVQTEMKEENNLTYREKFRLIPSLLKYLIPLILVYIAEYFVNQGVLELLYYNDEFLSMQEQYRWYQVDYQIGVFISRSSVNLIHINKLWILPILQIANMTLLIFQTYYRFIPNFWIVIGIVLWEGLIGGAAYVNTFYKLTYEITSRTKEFCISYVALGDATGIAIAGAAALPFHNYMCNLKIKI